MVHSARVAAVCRLVLGLLGLALAVALPLAHEESAPAPLLIALPLGLSAAIVLLKGFACLFTRIDFSGYGLAVSAPGWRALPLPPMRPFEAGWHEVLAIRRRIERYRLWMLPVAPHNQVFAIETTKGMIELSGRHVADLEAVLREVARRADCIWVEDGEIELPLLHTLMHGAPDWPTTGVRPEGLWQRSDACSARPLSPAGQKLTIAYTWNRWKGSSPNSSSAAWPGTATP